MLQDLKAGANANEKVSNGGTLNAGRILSITTTADEIILQEKFIQK